MLVELSKAELRDAYGRADSINAKLKKAGIKPNVFHGDNDEVMRNAMAAEQAFLKTFPGMVRSQSNSPYEGDGGWDFMCPRTRLTVDIKSRTSDDSILIIPGRHYPPKADIYVLGFVAERKVTLAGWAWGDDFRGRAKRSRGGPAGPFWFLYKDRLRTMNALFKEFR